MSDREKADILWLKNPIYNFSDFFDLTPHQLVNSFPFEFHLTIKRYLSNLSNRSGTGSVPITFDLLTEVRVEKKGY